jgi:hypothetical protein
MKPIPAAGLQAIQEEADTKNNILMVLELV